LQELLEVVILTIQPVEEIQHGIDDHGDTSNAKVQEWN